MKKFKQILSEVAEPIAGDEINFKKKHIIQRFYDPAGNDDAFTGNVSTEWDMIDGKRFYNRADYHDGEDEDVYESADGTMPYNTALDLSDKHAVAATYHKKAGNSIGHRIHAEASNKILDAALRAGDRMPIRSTRIEKMSRKAFEDHPVKKSVSESVDVSKHFHSSLMDSHMKAAQNAEKGSAARSAHMKAAIAHTEAWNAIGTKDEEALSSKAVMTSKMARRIEKDLGEDTDISENRYNDAYGYGLGYHGSIVRIDDESDAHGFKKGDHVRVGGLISHKSTWHSGTNIKTGAKGRLDPAAHDLIKESEQLDELSNSKLRSYAKAASDDAANSSDPKRIAKRTDGVLKASEKINENDDYSKRRYHAQMQDHHYDRAYKHPEYSNSYLAHMRAGDAHLKAQSNVGKPDYEFYSGRAKKMSDLLEAHSTPLYDMHGSEDDDVNNDGIIDDKDAAMMRARNLVQKKMFYHTEDIAKDDTHIKNHGTKKKYAKINSLLAPTHKVKSIVEEEQLDEISINLKQKYFDKSNAAKRASGYGYDGHDADGKFKGNDHPDHQKANRRMKFMNKVQDDLHNHKNPVHANVHDLSHMKDDGDVYDHTQTNEKIKDGDVLKLHGGRAGVMVKAWPVITHGNSDALHKVQAGSHISKIDKGRYKKSFEVASKHATAPELKESEDLQELSKDTLKSYIKKAVDNHGFSNRWRGRDNKDMDAKRDSEKRASGIIKAANKLAEDGAAYAIGMSKAKEIHNDEPPLRKKTIKTAHKIAKSILGESTLLGPKTDIHKAASINQSDREYAIQKSFKNKWKLENPGKEFPGYEKAGFKMYNESDENCNCYHIAGSEDSHHIENLKSLAPNSRISGGIAKVSRENEEAIAYMDKYFPSIHESDDQLDEISNEMKAKYLDKAVQQRYDFFTGGRNTPAQKRRKPASHYEQPEIKKALAKDAKRGEIIDKTAKALTGTPHYSKMSTSTSPAVHGNADAWWRGKKYATEGVEQIDEAMKLDSVNIVHHDNDSAEFAKKYVKAHKGDHRPGGPTAADERAQDQFYTDHGYKHIRQGFGGSGETHYKEAKTGHIYSVRRVANGKGFHGTDHIVRKLNESEELQELSKGTLGRYINRSADDLKDIQGDIRGNGTNSPSYKNLSRLRKNRKTGIANAVKQLTKESLSEAFSAGSLKLNDGSYVTVNKQDAALLNQMFNDLNPGNRKKMEKVLMTDKHGFQEILGFAREAL